MNSRRLICLPRLGAVYKHSERYHIEPWPYLNWVTLITADAIAFGVGAVRTTSGHVWTAPCGQALFGVVTIAVGCSRVFGLLVQPFFTTAGPDVVREVGPDQFHGLSGRDPKKVLPPRRPTDQHHAISTSATP